MSGCVDTTGVSVVLTPVVVTGEPDLEQVVRRTYERKMQMFPMSGYDPGVTPDWSFLPFMGTLKQLVGSTVAVGLLGLVAAGVIGAVTWAVSAAVGAHRLAQYAKGATIISVVLAMVVGGYSGLVRWGAGIGAGW